MMGDMEATKNATDATARGSGHAVVLVMNVGAVRRPKNVQTVIAAVRNLASKQRKELNDGMATDKHSTEGRNKSSSRLVER